MCEQKLIGMPQVICKLIMHPFFGKAWCCVGMWICGKGNL